MNEPPQFLVDALVVRVKDTTILVFSNDVRRPELRIREPLAIVGLIENEKENTIEYYSKRLVDYGAAGNAWLDQYFSAFAGKFCATLLERCGDPKLQNWQRFTAWMN